MQRVWVVVASLVALAACSEGGERATPAATTTTAPPMDELVRMNQVQVLGTHNSYHRRLPPDLFEILRGFDPKFADSVDYEHRPIDDQLDAGIRQLELDVFADPDGGRFASRAANPLVGRPRESGIEELARPGFKVLHVPEVDYESSCLSLATCLRTVVDWSDDHPRHLPIMVLVEAKDSGAPDVAGLGFATPLPFDAAQLDALDAEIRRHVDDDKLLTPDEVRGDRPTLREAVATDGWPTLAESRGRVLFTLTGDEEKRERYVEGHASLAGRAMFVSGTGSPESAVVSRPDATTAAADIGALARQGFLVRTRADADTVEARTGATARRDAALASAATWISTDFPQPDPTLGAGGYSVELRPRCHPVLAPPACKDERLEP